VKYKHSLILVITSIIAVSSAMPGWGSAWAQEQQSGATPGSGDNNAGSPTSDTSGNDPGTSARDQIIQNTQDQINQISQDTVPSRAQTTDRSFSPEPYIRPDGTPSR
jgi:hypothetical protein